MGVLASVALQKNLPAKWSPTENVAWKLPLPQWSGATPVIWNDATLGITWPIDGQPIISSKDAKGTTLQAAEVYA